MYSLSTLICVYLLLAFTSHPAFTAAFAIGEAALRPKADLFDLSDLPAGEDKVEDAVETEAFNELDEGDVGKDVLMPAVFRRIPVKYKCVYDRRSKRLRCFPSPQFILLRH
mgnify:CR=1 FL=1